MRRSTCHFLCTRNVYYLYISKPVRYSYYIYICDIVCVCVSTNIKRLGKFFLFHIFLSRFTHDDIMFILLYICTYAGNVIYDANSSAERRRRNRSGAAKKKQKDSALSVRGKKNTVLYDLTNVYTTSVHTQTHDVNKTIWRIRVIRP